MSLEKKDLIILPITDEMRNMARYIAEKRSLFEYPRFGYGIYKKEKHINNYEYFRRTCIFRIYF